MSSKRGSVSVPRQRPWYSTNQPPRRPQLESKTAKRLRGCRDRDCRLEQNHGQEREKAQHNQARECPSEQGRERKETGQSFPGFCPNDYENRYSPFAKHSRQAFFASDLYCSARAPS